MTPLILLLALAAAAITALTYVTFCYLSPFGRCRRCRAGWARQPLCRRCDGTGHRLRIAIRAWHAWTRLHRDATREYPTTLTNPTTDKTTGAVIDPAADPTDTRSNAERSIR